MTRAVVAPVFHDVQWLELALDYRCNLRCLGCRACDGEGGSMTSREALGWLAWGRRQAARGLWLGGGEPTLRDDLLGLVRAGRKLGFGNVLVQTNGARLSYEHYARALIDAGVTHVRVNVKSHDAATHDRLSGEEGALLRATQAMAHLRGQVTLAADVLLTRETGPQLPGTVAFLADRGVTEVSLWLLSTADGDRQEVRDQVPRIADLHHALDAAHHAAAAAGVDLWSFHTPPCTLPPHVRPRFRPAASLGLVVVDPGGRPFAVADSPIEGGAYLPTCERCAARATCPGPRADYRALHGDGEFVPLP